MTDETSTVVPVELGSRSYDILFAGVDSPEAEALFRRLPQQRVLLTADSHTVKFAPRVTAALEKAGKQVELWSFPAGERSKSIDTAMALCARATELGMGRDALFAALGGGVTGDLTGFAASIFLRGVPFLQIPTSLLAMVDSSIGGKTAVDTPAGKNLVGAFHQPAAVLIDCDFLADLPPREIGNGMAEIIKTAMLGDAELAHFLAEYPAEKTLDAAFFRHVVAASCCVKAAVVATDEEERGDVGRILLNYGHTFGHALEHLSRFLLAHGEAVAVGMDMAAFTACRMQICRPETAAFQRRLLARFGLDVETVAASHPVDRRIDRIVEMMHGDKKNRDGRFRAVLPETVGRVAVKPLEEAFLKETLQAYFSERFSTAAQPDARPTVAVLGLGLLGTSLALALDRSQYRVTAWCRREEVRKLAALQGVVEEFYDTPEEALRRADIAVLALPVPVTVAFIRRCGSSQKPGAVLTDIASVKSEVMAAAEEVKGLSFVGSHPMAGTEKSGPAAAFAELYDNADVFLVPGRATPEAVSRVEALWRSIGTHPRRITAAAHDELVANTSHMLHLIASALTQSILDEPDAAGQLRNYSGCATGFRDTSRIASSSPRMWREICLANYAKIAPALASFQKRLGSMCRALEQGEGEAFEKLFALGRDLRDSWLCYKAAEKLPAGIVLCGVKHCGKSAVMAELSAILDLECVDTDDWLAKRYEKMCGARRSVREIYRELGEEAFRRLEAEVVGELARDAAAGCRRVIALGGGSVTNPFIDGELLKKLGFAAEIDVPDEVAFARIERGGLPPFLADEPDPLAAFAKMNRERRRRFKEVADVTVTPASADTPHRTALQILSLYKRNCLQ